MFFRPIPAGFVACLLLYTPLTGQIFAPHPNLLPGNGFAGVVFVDSQTGWVGTDNAIAFTNDAGETWELKQPTPFSAYTNLVARGPDSVWAADFAERIWRTFDRGQTWDLFRFGQGSVQEIAINDAGVVIAVGSAPPPIRGPIWRSVNDSDWVQVISPADRSFLLGVAFADDTTVYAGGSEGFLIKSVDAGLTWTNQESGLEAINNFLFHDALTGFALGDNGDLIATTDGGENWERVDAGTTKNLLVGTFTSRDDGWIVGRQGVILYTRDGGTTWNVLEAGGPFRYDSISFGDPDHGWITGNGDVEPGRVLLKTTEGTTVASRVEIPNVLRSGSAFPNPFRSSTKISFSLDQGSYVEVDVFNVLGQEVATLGQKSYVSGDHTIVWDAKGAPNGLYFYEIRAGSTSRVGSMIILR